MSAINRGQEVSLSGNYVLPLRDTIKDFSSPEPQRFCFFKLLNDPTADQKIVGSGNEDAIKETTGLHAQVAERADKEDEVNWSSWSTK